MYGQFKRSSVGRRISSLAAAAAVGPGLLLVHGAQAQTAPLQQAAPVTVAQASSPPPTQRPQQPANDAPPQAPAKLEEITITGSRILRPGEASPTPVTSVSTAQLAATTPSNIPDALNKLPEFSGSNNQTTIGNSSANNAGNFLNLRNFGEQRTLILFDGNRVPPTTASGTVDINTLPQGLIERVDVVTGGASAVYGSDAVTGVVNFILNKHFNGIKYDVQTGMSTYGDDGSVKASLVGGTSLFDGRGHIEGSFDHYHSDGIASMLDRPNGQGAWSLTGTGTPSDPFALTGNTRQTYITFGGIALSGPFAGQNFTTNGILSPFFHGAPTGSAGIESGGDGGWDNQTVLTAPLTTDQAFGRFDFDVSDSTEAYLQAGYGHSTTSYDFYPVPEFDMTILSGNGFLPAAAQQQLTATNTPSFVMAKFFDNWPSIVTNAVEQNIDVMTGLDGELSHNLNWHLNFTYGQSQQRVSSPYNINSSRLAASLDAVVNPATGNVTCQVSLTSYASLYPGCQPLNPFGPTSASLGAAAYVLGLTEYTLTNSMYDFSGSVSGPVIRDWAGPVSIALSGEARRLTLDNNSDAQPTATADCTGLRANCIPGATPEWQSNVVASMTAAETVSEGAVEVLVPLLANVTMAKNMDFNGAARFTHYSTSGNVTTWKAGLTWNLTDEIELRGTRSRDIRAPTLTDLYSPLQAGIIGFDDLHTGVNATLFDHNQGNPTLVPEVANTTTVGLVFRPNWWPRASLTLDYFKIHLANAITLIDGNNAAVQQQCEQSNGASPLCALYARPHPFSDRSPDNYPTAVYAEELNVADSETDGVDGELNFDIGSRWQVRGLVSYQPSLKTTEFPGAAPIQAAGVYGLSKTRVALSAGYKSRQWEWDVMERWQSGQLINGTPGLVFDVPNLPSIYYTDLALQFTGWKSIIPYLSVQNAFNKQPPIAPSTFSAGVPGLFYPVPNGGTFDIVGRYFTVGLRGQF